GPGGAAPALEDAHRGGRPDGGDRDPDLRPAWELRARGVLDRRPAAVHDPAPARGGADRLPRDRAQPSDRPGGARVRAVQRPGRADAGDPAATGALAERRPAVHAVFERAARVTDATRTRAQRRDGLVGAS